MRPRIWTSDHQHKNWWPHFLNLVVHFVVVVEKNDWEKVEIVIFLFVHILCVSPAYLHLLSSRVSNVFPKGSMLLRSIATFLWEKVNWTKDEIIIKGNTFHFHQNMSKIFFLQSKNMNPNINHNNFWVWNFLSESDDMVLK